MYCNLMLAHVLTLEHIPIVEDSGTDDEKCRFELLLIKIFKQVGCVEGRAVIVSQTPVHSSRAVCDISGACTSAACPPASRGVISGSRVIRASTSCKIVRNVEFVLKIEHEINLLPFVVEKSGITIPVSLTSWIHC